MKRGNWNTSKAELSVRRFRRSPPGTCHHRSKYHPELGWLFGEAEAACGARSNMASDADRVFFGALECDYHQDWEPNIRAVGLMRKIEKKFSQLPVRLQRVLEIWYTQLHLDPGELVVREAHKAYGDLG